MITNEIITQNLFNWYFCEAPTNTTCSHNPASLKISSGERAFIKAVFPSNPFQNQNLLISKISLFISVVIIWSSLEKYIMPECINAKKFLPELIFDVPHTGLGRSQ